MNFEVVTVPKDECPINKLAEMGCRIKNSWIFFDDNCFKKLKNSKGVVFEHASDIYTFTWQATKDYPKTMIILKPFECGWLSTLAITADDIAFKIICEEPLNIFLLKMEQ
ncbi:MAG: hypothetical protein IKT41_02630 [Clostridia bacterium]|nr:hypothetical protein [Clostridia bacterium]